MMSLMKLAPLQFNLLSKCASSSIYNSARSIFSPSVFGIDSFKLYCVKMERENKKNYDLLKSTLQETLKKPDAKIFTEDLKTFLYLTKTDSDLELLIASVKKYNSQDSVALFNYRFETPLMRLLYTMNKTDRACDLYLKEEIKFEDNLSRAPNMLLNKLIEEQKYEEAIKVYEKSVAKVKNARKAESKIVLSLTTTDLITEALLEKGDADAAKKAKEIIKDIEQNSFPIRNRAIIKLFILALRNNETEFAYELIIKLKDASPVVVNNLKILSLLSLNRRDEALKLALDTEKMYVDRINLGRFFKITFDKLLDAFKDDTDGKKKVEELVDNIKRKNQMFSDDLKEHAMRLIERKRLDNNNNNNESQRMSPNQGFTRQNANYNRRPLQQQQQQRDRDGNQQTRNSNNINRDQQNRKNNENRDLSNRRSNENRDKVAVN